MNNFSLKLKMFLKNKNTVTIFCALIGIAVLIVGYNWRVNNAVKPVKVPYALTTIQPRTKITKDMIGYKSVAKAAISEDVILDLNALLKNDKDDELYSNANTIIPKGSMFYKGTVVKKKELPDVGLYDMPLDETLYYLPVNITTSYSNSILPGNYIDIYIQTITRDEDGDSKVMVGKLLSNVLVRAVKTSNGLNVFENSDEARIPATIIFSVKEEIHLLLRKATSIGNLSSEYKIDIIPVPNTTGYEGNPIEDGEKVITKVTSEYLKEFIEEKSIFIPEDEIIENIEPDDEEENVEDTNDKDNNSGIKDFFDKNTNNKNNKDENNNEDEE